MTRRRVDGTFIEDIEMDVRTGAYERINVPPILESRRSTVLHDFETVISVVVCIVRAVLCVHQSHSDQSDVMLKLNCVTAWHPTILTFSVS